MQLTDFIGKTPLVEIDILNTNPNVKLYAKLEGFNPGGSVKDRAAYNMISSALKRGDISPKTQLIEATSGNTGIDMSGVTTITAERLSKDLILSDIQAIPTEINIDRLISLNHN